MPNYLKLNIHFNPLIVPDDRFRKWYHLNIDIDKEINPELIDWLAKEDIKILSGHTFYSEPGYTQNIHIDDVAPFDRVKLNFVYEGRGSKMYWYKLKPNVAMPEKNMTGAGRTYLQFSPHEVDIIDSTEISSPTLVQVGVPHNVINPIEYRLCISLLLRDLPTGNIISMNEVCHRLGKYKA